MFDTHCHLNFKAFNGRVDQVISEAKKVGVTHIVVPGTDVETSKKAVEIAEKFENVYAAVGIHPHHVFELNVKRGTRNVQDEIKEIEKLLINKKVVAVGEVGLDRHVYQKTVYQEYQVNQEFIELQREFFQKQIDLAIKYKKTLILHNREAKKDFLPILSTNYSLLATIPIVFHCCEPDDELLEFAKKHKIYIGVDGDITYRKDKQEFVKKVPLEMLVLETDSPFLHPEPFRSEPRATRGPNEPKNLKIIAEFISKLLGVSMYRFIDKVSENSEKLFQL